MNAVELDDISYAHGRSGALALAGISACVAQGAIAGLVGPDGAGKTTLLRVVAGLFRPRGGRVAVLGHDMATGHRPALADGAARDDSDGARRHRCPPRGDVSRAA